MTAEPDTAGTDSSTDDGYVPDERFEMLYADRRYYANNLSDFVAAIIPGYANMSEWAKYEARLLYMIQKQTEFQAQLNLNPRFDSLPYEARQLLSTDRSNPPVVAAWDHPIPLVLIRNFYKPDGHIHRPVRTLGMEPNIVWLDSADDESFLLSLHDIEVLSLHVREGHAG